MKKLIIFLSISLNIAFASYAQPYESIFGKDSTKWIFEWGNFFGYTQDTAYVEKDTIYLNDTWKKIVCTNNMFPHLTNYFGGLLKEDTVTGKVWYKAYYDPVMTGNDTSVQLIFDFGLITGDTFNLTGIWGPISYPDNKVDTVVYINGLKHILFKQKIPFANEYVTFIEGVGSNLGVIYRQIQSRMTQHYLLCSYKDDVKTYSNPFYNGNCDIYGSTGINQDLIDLKFNIYPNPFTDKITIDQKEIIDYHIMIHDFLGRNVYRGNSEKEIYLDHLPNGFYYLQIQNNAKPIYKTTLIKN